MAYAYKTLHTPKNESVETVIKLKWREQAITNLQLSEPLPVRQFAVGSYHERADSWKTLP